MANNNLFERASCVYVDTRSEAEEVTVPEKSAVDDVLRSEQLQLRGFVEDVEDNTADERVVRDGGALVEVWVRK